MEPSRLYNETNFLVALSDDIPLPDFPISVTDFLKAQSAASNSCDDLGSNSAACSRGVNQLAYEFKRRAGFYKNPLIDNLAFDAEEIKKAVSSALHFCASYYLLEPDTAFLTRRWVNSCNAGVIKFSKELKGIQTERLLQQKISPQLIWAVKDDAEEIFRKNRNMSRVEKVEDLLETSPLTRIPTPLNLIWWKQDIKHRDLEGVDTRHPAKADALMNEVLPSNKYKLAKEYLKADGDKIAYKSKDKPMLQAIEDEIAAAGDIYAD